MVTEPLAPSHCVCQAAAAASAVHLLGCLLQEGGSVGVVPPALLSLCRC